MTYPKSAQTITPGKSANNAQIYTYVRPPNQTADQLLEWATNKHRELTRHEMVLQARMPADSLMTARSLVRLQGTGTIFDQDYFPDSVKRGMSVDSGYWMDVHAKNHNTDSEVNL